MYPIVKTTFLHVGREVVLVIRNRFLTDFSFFVYGDEANVEISENKIQIRSTRSSSCNEHLKYPPSPHFIYRSILLAPSYLWSVGTTARYRKWRVKVTLRSYHYAHKDYTSIFFFYFTEEQEKNQQTDRVTTASSTTQRGTVEFWAERTMRSRSASGSFDLGLVTRAPTTQPPIRLKVRRKNMNKKEQRLRLDPARTLASETPSSDSHRPIINGTWTNGNIPLWSIGKVDTGEQITSGRHSPIRWNSDHANTFRYLDKSEPIKSPLMRPRANTPSRALDTKQTSTALRVRTFTLHGHMNLQRAKQNKRGNV